MKYLIQNVFLIFSFNLIFAQDKLHDSANQGDTKAMLQIAENFELGINSYKINKDSTIFYWKKAASKGDPDAFYLLGVSYLRGFPLQKNIKEGLELLNKAADLNHILSLELLSEIYFSPDSSIFTQNSEKIAKNYKKSFEYILKAAQFNNPKSMIKVSKYYSKGWGTNKSDSLAIIWMQKAADKYKVPEAQIQMGDWYFTGEVFNKPDFKKAYFYYKSAEFNKYSELEESIWGNIGQHDLVQAQLFEFDQHIYTLFPIFGFDFSLRIDYNSVKFMVDKELYFKEMEESQLKKLKEAIEKEKERMKKI